MRYLILSVLVLAGCATPAPSQGPTAREIRECRDLAVAYQLEDTRTFMRQCLAVRPEDMPLPVIEPRMSGYAPGYANGPYGPMGPTWQEFNQVFQQPLQPYQFVDPNHPRPRR